MAIDYKPEQNDYTNLTPFKTWLVNQINTWGINNFPFLESNFDKLTNYGMMMKLMKAMNDVIGNQNLVESDMSNLFNAFTELQNYINNYFDNLDIQEEINNKLDEMAESGELTNLIKGYVDPIYQAYENRINNNISDLRNEVESIASGNPTPVNSINEMTDTTKVYLLLTDGYIYYYNGTNWVQGWVYQSTIIDFDNTLKNITKPVSSLFTGKNLDGLYTIKETIEHTKESSSGSEYYNIKLDQNEVLKITVSNTDLSNESRISFRTGLSNQSNDIVLDQYSGNYTFIFKLPKPFYRIQLYTTKANTNLKIERLELNYNPLEDNFLKNTLLSYNMKENVYNYKESLSIQKNIRYLINIKKGELFHIKAINSIDNVAILFQKNIDNTYTTINRIYSNTKGNGIDSYYIANDNYDRIEITFYNDKSILTDYFISINKYINKTNKTIACFGDSITSEQVCGIGTMIGEKINANKINNYAVGFATCTDWHIGDTNTTPINLQEPANAKTNDNVLSNQVRRCLQNTTPLGEQITWDYLGTTYSIDTSYGTGLGNTDEVPDIIYIAIGINDGDDEQTPYDINDIDTVINQNYSQLTRNSMSSALKWAIETLRCAYPNSQIFVATPLQTQRTSGHTGTSAYIYKHDLIKKISDSESCSLIDTTYNSGVSKYIIQKYNRSGQSATDIHPSKELSYKIADFVANEIKYKLFK